MFYKKTKIILQLNGMYSKAYTQFGMSEEYTLVGINESRALDAPMHGE